MHANSSLDPDHFAFNLLHELQLPIKNQRGKKWRQKKVFQWQAFWQENEVRKNPLLNNDEYGYGYGFKLKPFLIPLPSYPSPISNRKLNAEYIQYAPNFFSLGSESIYDITLVERRCQREMVDKKTCTSSDQGTWNPFTEAVFYEWHLRCEGMLIQGKAYILSLPVSIFCIPSERLSTFRQRLWCPKKICLQGQKLAP